MRYAKHNDVYIRVVWILHPNGTWPCEQLLVSAPCDLRSPLTLRIRGWWIRSAYPEVEDMVSYVCTYVCMHTHIYYYTLYGYPLRM